MPVTMSDPAKEWIVAAACREGPPPPATFADLPKAYRHDLLRFGTAAAGSVVFFVALFVLLQPLPSRSLAMHITLPRPVSPAAVVIAREAPDAPGAPRPLRRDARPRNGLQPASQREAVGTTGADAPKPERRRNIFSRFFRTIARTMQPGPQRTEPGS